MLSADSRMTLPVKFPLKLSADEVELILEALAELPFKRVFACIAQLNEQATRAFLANGQRVGPVAQVAQGAQGAQMAEFQIDAEQMRLMLEVLPQLPYQRVHLLLQRMHLQLVEAKGAAA